jgi:hypothetical protein
MTERHRLRVAVDVIYEGPKLSPTAQRNVAAEVSTETHVIAFQDIKNVEVVYIPLDQRTFYAHHHNSEDGGYCREKSGCIQQAQDGLNQEDL